MNITTRFSSVSVIIALAVFSAGAFLVSASPAFAAITSTTVTSPNGAEIWSGTHNLTWSSTNDGVDGLVNIYYCVDNGGCASSTYIPIASSQANTGSYSWNTASAGGDGKIG